MFKSASSPVAPSKQESSPNRYSNALIELFESQFKVDSSQAGAVVAVGEASLVELFLEHRYPIAVVDPNAQVRARCERLIASQRGASVHEGTPDATGLADASLDFVASARALYWPNQVGVAKEFRRILRPGGAVALVTDTRVYSGGEQSEDYVDLLRTHCATFKEKAEPYDIAGAVSRFFAGNDVYEDAFIGHQQLTFEGLVDQTCALSIYPPEGDPEQQRIEVALRKHFKRFAVEGILMVPKVSRVAFGHLN